MLVRCNVRVTDEEIEIVIVVCRYESGEVTLTKKTGAEGFFDDGLTYLFQKPNEETGEQELWPVRPKHIHFEVRSEFEGDSMEFCDFRFYSVEKVEPAE